MKKVFFLFCFAMVVSANCFSQNMLIVGGDYNPFKPVFWNGNIGFNLELFNENIQDDLLLNFGSLTAENEQGKEPQKFIFSIKDNFFYSLDGRFVGLRAGVSASFGIYDIPEFPKSADLFFTATGLVGICILPKSLISITLDLCPGYAVAFRATDAPGLSLNDSGFILPMALGIRVNLDKF
jgi:hypothetical protein